AGAEPRPARSPKAAGEVKGEPSGPGQPTMNGGPARWESLLKEARPTEPVPEVRPRRNMDSLRACDECPQHGVSETGTGGPAPFTGLSQQAGPPFMVGCCVAIIAGCLLLAGCHS